MKNTLTAAEQQMFSDFLKNIDWNDPHDKNRKALATTIVESVRQDIYTQDVAAMIADQRTFGPGEELQFKTREGLVAYVIDPGSFAPRSQITNTVVTLPKKTITVATELDLNQLRSGRYGSIADIKQQAAEQILGAKSKMVWDASIAAVTSSTADSNYRTVASTASASTKKTALDAAISYLEDYTQAGAKAIIGRFSSLSFLEDLDNTIYPDQMRQQIYQGSGFLGNYKGVPVFRLKSFLNVYDVQQVSANNILVLGEGTVKVGIQEPGLEMFEQVKGTTTHSWEMAFWISLGVACVETQRMYNIALT